MDASGPIASSCVRDMLFSELRFVEADIGFLAGTPTIIRLEISITRAKQACEFPATHTVSGCILCSCFPLLGPFEDTRWPYPGVHQGMLLMDARAQLDAVFLLPCFPLWGPFENARWTFPGIHQRMLDGRPLVPIRECSMDTSGPIPSSCAAET